MENMGNMEIRKGLLYSREHEWVKTDGDYVYIGITDFAQHSLGDIVYVDLPKPGEVLKEGDALGVVESVKAASDIYTPLTVEVTEVNTGISNEPGVINSSPYDAWFIKAKLVNKVLTSHKFYA